MYFFSMVRSGARLRITLNKRQRTAHFTWTRVEKETNQREGRNRREKPDRMSRKYDKQTNKVGGKNKI